MSPSKRKREEKGREWGGGTEKKGGSGEEGEQHPSLPALLIFWSWGGWDFQCGW